MGLGCRKDIAAAPIVDLARAALARLLHAPQSVRLYTIERKAHEQGLRAAAEVLGYDLVFLPEAALAERQADFIARGATPSAKARALAGLDSVAEAAALFGAGPGATLIVPRLAAQGVTCAIAADRGEFEAWK
jgi:cobalt-precorrin 5A hydrolase